MSSVQRRQHVSHTHGGGCPHFAHLFGAFLFGGESQKSHLSSPRAAWNKNWIPDVAPDPVSSWVWTARTTEAGPGLETPVNSHQALPTCRAGRGQPRPRGPRVCGTGPRAFGPVPAPSGVWWPVPQESPCAASVPRQPKQPRRGRLLARGPRDPTPAVHLGPGLGVPGWDGAWWGPGGGQAQPGVCFSLSLCTPCTPALLSLK